VYDWGVGHQTRSVRGLENVENSKKRDKAWNNTDIHGNYLMPKALRVRGKEGKRIACCLCNEMNNRDLRNLVFVFLPCI
jgi:hypothetical protein